MNASHEFAGAYIRQLLQLVEDFINLDERGQALGMLAKAKRCVELAATPVAEAETEADQKSIAERIDAVRAELFDSTAVIDVARRAVSPDHDWYLRHVLKVAIERLDDTCTALELLARDAGERQEVAHG